MSTPAPPPKGYENYIDSPQSIAPPKGYEAYRDLPGAPVSLANPTQVAPLVGRGVAASLPVIGGAIGGLAGGGPDPITAGAGAGLGSVVAQELRNEFPKIFGKLDNSPGGFATQVGSDALLNGVAPELGGMAANSLAKGNLLPRILANKFIQKLPSVAEGTEDARLAELTKPGETLGGQALGENQNVNTIISKGIKDGKVTNPDAMLKELNKSDYMFTVSPESRAAIEELAKNATSSGDTGSRVLNYVKGRLALSTGAALLGGTLGHPAVAGAGIYLTDAVLGKLLANPTTAKLTLTALRTPAEAPQAKLLGTILSNTIRGLEIPAETKDQ